MSLPYPSCLMPPVNAGITGVRGRVRGNTLFDIDRPLRARKR